jgi:hypothetical protein
MNARAAALLLAAGLAGCASDGAEPAEKMPRVTGAERDAYWVDRDRFGMGLRAIDCVSSAVAVEYTIRNGNVRDVRILQSRPPAPDTESLVRDYLRERRFDPALENPQQRAVRVQEEFEVYCGGAGPRRR